MKCLTLIFLLLLLTGCVRTEKHYSNMVEVQGVGFDATFYPIFSVRFGSYKYVIIKNDNKNIKNQVLIIK